MGAVAAWSKFSEWSRAHFLWILVFFWIVFFAKPWLAIALTKFSEFQQLVGQSTFAQMRVLQGDELDVIQAVYLHILPRSALVRIVVPPNGTYPLLGATAMWRAVFGSSEFLVSPSKVTSADVPIIMPVPGETYPWNPTKRACEARGCECPAWNISSVQYWEVP